VIRRETDEKAMANPMTDQPRVYKEVKRGEGSHLFHSVRVFSRRVRKGSLLFRRQDSYFTHAKKAVLSENIESKCKHTKTPESE
jgi:hypothetical protein